MIIYSLRPVSMLSDFAQRKTNPKSEMTHCYSGGRYIVTHEAVTLLLTRTLLTVV